MNLRLLTVCWGLLCCFVVVAGIAAPGLLPSAEAAEAVQQPELDLDEDDPEEDLEDLDDDDEEDAALEARRLARQKENQGSSDKMREQVFGADILVRQRRPFPRKHRFGVVPSGILNTNDPLQSHAGFGGTVRYHLAERHSIGGRFMTYVNLDKPLRKQLQVDLSVFPERTDISYDTQLVYSYSPIDGKFSVLGAGIAHFDAYVQGGLGVADTFIGLNPAALLGVGVRVYLTGWLAMEFEVNDTAFVEEYPAGSRLVHHLTLGLGAALYLPFQASSGGGR